MNRVVKWLGLGIGAVLAVVLVAVVVLYAAARNTVQHAEGRATVAGLSAPVETLRDANGVPHIVAATKADAMSALGYAHAQDRFWQMEVLRMTGQGRLSEMFGEPTVDIDRFLRTLGFMGAAERSVGAIPSDSRDLLEAYARGVNTFLDRDVGLLEPKLPPEFLILGHAPEPWKPAHSLLILKIMSLQLSMNLDREMKRLQLAAQGLSPDEVTDILPPHPLDNPPPLPDLRALYDLSKPPEKVAASADNRKNAKQFASILEKTGIWASNNWVFAGSRTQSGKPLLANDPHLGFGAPSLWYLAHLRWNEDGETRNAIGATIPAVPAVILGRNERVAWGFTNAGADVQDTFIEKVNPDQPGQYMAPDGWRDFETREEVLAVKGAEDIAFSVRSTRHGPVLPDGYRDLGKILPDHHVAALAWTGFSDRDVSFEVVSRLADTRTVAELRQIIERTVSPMQVIVAADVEGNIGMFAPAHVPVRNPASRIKGRAPSPGWTGKNDWQGTVSVSQLPAQENPASGALGSANSRIFGIGSEPFLTFDWDETYRQDRVFGAVLGGNGKRDVDDMIAGQTDDHSAAMLDLRDALLNRLDDEMSASAEAVLIRDWDGQMNRDRSEPLIMTAFHRNLMKAMYADELGPVLDAAFSASATVPLRALNGQASRDWCDDVTTSESESCVLLMNNAFRATIDELRKAHGDDPETWRWGSVHTVFNEHRPFSSVWPLSKLFDVERPTSGGNYTLRRAKTTLTDDEHPFRATHGAGYRAVYDFSDLDNSIYIQTTGQSGNPFSKHYDDFADLWADGKYIRMSTDPQDYEPDAKGKWVLAPPS